MRILGVQGTISFPSFRPVQYNVTETQLFGHLGRDKNTDGIWGTRIHFRGLSYFDVNYRLRFEALQAQENPRNLFDARGGYACLQIGPLMARGNVGHHAVLDNHGN